METLNGADSVASRYASIRFKSRLSKKAFAESLGIHPVVSGDIELGKRDPSRDVLVRLVRAYGIDINWLLTGQGAVRDRDGREGDGRGGEDGDGKVVHIDFVRQEAAAGRGVNIEDNPEVTSIPVLRSLIAPYRSEKVRAVEVRGDSMTGIGLDDRDIVLFVPEARTGDGVHVVSIASQLLVKRIHFDAAGKSVHVISENPQYPPRILSGGDLEQFRIEGKVIGWMHRY